MGLEKSILENAPVAIDQDQIWGVGIIPPDFHPDEIVDGYGCVLMPAFFNVHTHAAMTLERGWAEDLAFEDWLNKKIWVAESALEEEDIYWGASLAAVEMIQSGIVGFADHYFWMDQVARVVEDCGMKALLAWCHFGNGVDQELGKKSFEDTISFVERWKNGAGGRIKTSMGPHSTYMDPPDVLQNFAREALRLGVGAHIHLSESLEQVQNSRKKFGKTPVAHLDELGLLCLPEPTIVAHCNVLETEDYELLSRNSVFVAHTPKTYMKLAMDMPLVDKMRQKGIRVALGTDGPASNSDFNMWEMMRLTGLCQKFIHNDPTVMDRTSLVEMATRIPAMAMGFSDSGIIQVGNKADLILVDTSSPHMIPRHDLVAGLVYSGQPGDVRAVWCDGVCLYKNGNFLTLDYERICYEAEKRAFRLTGKEMKNMRTYNA